MTTKQYTAEDFANAEFARHPDGRTAMRFRADSRPWRNTTGRWLSDAEMADHGWVPVREAAAQPITLDALHAAWEGAEDGTVNKGDILIRTGRDGETFTVWAPFGSGVTSMDTRILHRAPKPPRPEGAEQLDALLDEWYDAPLRRDDKGLADWLAERGVRVTEEGEK